MAKIIDASPESVSQTLARWRRQGILEMRGRRIAVLAPERLRREQRSRLAACAS